MRTEEKLAMLLWVLEVLLPEEQQAIIFTCTRHHVEFVHNLLLKVRRDIASLLRHKFSPAWLAVLGHRPVWRV